MRTARVFTHLRCNQRCSYCSYRRPQDDPRFIARESVEARIDAALAEGAAEIAFTGGEPTMRGDLAWLVERAKRGGAQRVVLETNATLLDPERARALREAGLDRIAVNLVGYGVAVDTVTGDVGGFESTVRGIEAGLDAGLEVVVVAAIVRSSLALVPGLPAALVERFAGRVGSLVLVVPVDSPDPAELVPYADAVDCIEQVAAEARRVGMPVKLDSETAPPPCTFEELARVAHLFTLTPGGVERRTDRVRPSACGDCVLVDRCAGFVPAYVRARGVPAVEPVREDRMRRRLSLISTVEEQIARELVTRDRYGHASTGVVDEDLVRINFHCNQSCRFCFVSTHLPMAGDEAVRSAILDAARAGRRVTLSGGEPTLHPELVRYLRLAKEHSSHPVRIQTNAIRLAHAPLADAVVEAGLDEAFVSLHGSRAEISDAVTHAPGTFEKTVLGIDNLVARKVLVVLNFVVCETNLEDLVPHVRFVARRWPGVPLNISFVAPSTDVVPRDVEFVPRYSRVLPHLAEAFTVARELGVELIGFESMCGIPLCLVPSSLEGYAELLAHDSTYSAGEFVAAPACADCDLSGRCYGVRRGYASLHGVAELVPVRLSRDGAGA